MLYLFLYKFNPISGGMGLYRATCKHAPTLKEHFTKRNVNKIITTPESILIAYSDSRKADALVVVNLHANSDLVTQVAYCTVIGLHGEIDKACNQQGKPVKPVRNK